MAKFTLTLFLLTEASVPRLSHALLEMGFSIAPLCEQDKTHIVGKVSTAFVVTLISRTKTHIAASQAIINMLVSKDIPYYGGSVECDTERHVRLLVGHMPTKVKKTTPSPGPVRPSGEVISLAEFKKKQPN